MFTVNIRHGGQKQQVEKGEIDSRLDHNRGVSVFSSRRSEDTT